MQIATTDQHKTVSRTITLLRTQQWQTCDT